MALGSAAVLSVYAAGFSRTNTVAEALEAQDSARRRPVMPAAASQPDTELAGAESRAVSASLAKQFVPDQPARTDASDRTVTGPEVSSATAAAPNLATDSGLGKKQPGETLSRQVPAERTDMVTQTFGTESSLGKAPGVVAGTSVRQESSLGQTAPAAPTQFAAVNPSIIAPPAAATVAKAASAPAKAPEKAPAKSSAVDSTPAPAGWADGTYIGYGASRHGDVESTVVIEKGKIVAAAISRCLTQYSCSWIAHLQQQVVTRQSPEVDNVSGATHSANAFYYSVVEALNKAK